MSKFELFLIIGACLTPFIALIFILPKRKKQKTPPPTTSYVKDKSADKPEVKPETKTAEVKPVQKKVSKSDLSKPNFGIDDEFQKYLEQKRKITPAPKPIDEPSFVKSPVGEYIPARLRAQSRLTETTQKSVADQIKELSPELKAMLIAGILDKKDFE